MKNSARSSRVAVSADGRGLVSQAGAVLLWETLRVTGLGRGLSAALQQWQAPQAVHDPGKIRGGPGCGAGAGRGLPGRYRACCGSSPPWPGRWRQTRWYPGWSAPWRRTCRGR